MVAGDVAGLARRHQAGGVGEAVPVAGAGAVGERRALDLVGGGRGAPEEVVGKGRDSRQGHLRGLMPRALVPHAVTPAVTRPRRLPAAKGLRNAIEKRWRGLAM